MTLPTFDVPRTTARCICGRTLRDPLSVSRKTGPVCWAKTHPAPARRPGLPRRRAVMAAPAPRTARPHDEQLLLDIDDVQPQRKADSDH